jgi:uncharacterized damage-inducible protein DinB
MERIMPTENALPLSFVFDGWQNFQDRLVQVVGSWSREQLELPVSAAHWPLGMLVQHIINTRIWWFHVWMDEGLPEVTAFMRWEEEEEGRSIHTPAELVAGLRASWDMIAGALAHWTVADLDQIVPQPPSLTEREREIFGPDTRQAIIFHVLRHDLHHGGELAVGMGVHGMPIFWG